jgi:hypothetical protein
VDVECGNEGDTGSNTAKWNHLKILQKIPESRNGKARNTGYTENSHIFQCTYTRISESTNAKSKALSWEIALHVSRIVTAKYQQHHIP